MMKKVVFIILDQFGDWEGAYLAAGLSLVGNGAFQNVFASVSKDAVYTVGGMEVRPAADLSACSSADMLVLVGGTSWKTELSEKVVPVVQEYWKTGKPIGAIGYSVSLLASCGFLNDLRHTGTSANELKSWAQDSYTGEKLFEEGKGCVTDGRLVTADSNSPVEFSRDMMLLAGISKADAQEWYVFNKSGNRGAAPAKA